MNRKNTAAQDPLTRRRTDTRLHGVT